MPPSTGSGSAQAAIIIIGGQIFDQGLTVIISGQKSDWKLKFNIKTAAAVFGNMFLVISETYPIDLPKNCAEWPSGPTEKILQKLCINETCFKFWVQTKTCFKFGYLFSRDSLTRKVLKFWVLLQ